MTEKWLRRETMILEMGLGEGNDWHRTYQLVPHLFVPYVSIKVLRSQSEKEDIYDGSCRFLNKHPGCIPKESCSHPEGQKQKMSLVCVVDDDPLDDGGMCHYFEEPEAQQ